MDKTQYSKICRTCLSEKPNLKTVFSEETIVNELLTLSEMLMSIATVNISANDDLPSNICSQCIEELRRAFSFKKQCEHSENSLKRQCIIPTSDNCEIKNESCKDEEHMSSNLCHNSNHEPSNDSFCSIAESVKIQLEEVSDKKKNSYNCEECGEVYLGLAAYVKHMAKVHERRFKCPICNKEFKTQNLLSKHKNTEHSDISRVKSRNRRGITTKKKNLPRSCDVCKKSFRYHSNLERHKLTHTGEKPYLCNVCGKGFSQLSYLKIHSFIHTGEKPYKCEMCDKSFAAPGTLMTHVRIHTGERPHICKICGKDFLQSGYLSAHVRTHTGEKPVECKVCHRRFNQSGRLIIHMRIHSGEKPFTCNECGRSFAVKGTLKKHVRTHTGERPYICSICGQGFAQSGTLATHMRVHNKSKV